MRFTVKSFCSMPIVLIIVGLALAIGLGGYFLRPEEVASPVETAESPAPQETASVVPDTTPTSTPADTATTSATPAAPTAPTTAPAVATPITPAPATPVTPATPKTTYADGAHTVNTAYRAPENLNHTMAVTLTLKGDVVTGSSITFGGDKKSESSKYQSRFMAAYESQVIGKKLDDIKLSRVGGASLTTNGFNDALAKVKAAATN